MKKIWFFPLLAVPLAVAAFTLHWHNDAPTYVKDAEERVSSYLSYSYGPTKCMSDQNDANAWTMECQIITSKRDLKYTVYPADKASEGTPRSFFMVAENKDAQLSAKADLMVYLDIGSHDS
ncbi:hypothetical protein [Buttiauxella brennerae]|uniref:hypothetical protein n=1 Tax=Buttiauxella brennerae TaxID=82988 RepID=UPI00286EDA69|nr:hypothetical protein [Buttiauxella brennerae]